MLIRLGTNVSSRFGKTFLRCKFFQASTTHHLVSNTSAGTFSEPQGSFINKRSYLVSSNYDTDETTQTPTDSSSSINEKAIEKNKEIINVPQGEWTQEDMDKVHELMKTFSNAISPESGPLAQSLLDRIKLEEDAGNSNLSGVPSLYFMTLKAWAKGRSSEAPSRCKEVLSGLSKFENKVGVMAPTYTIFAIGDSDDPNKATEAYEMLTKLMEGYRNENYDPAFLPRIAAYNAVLSACCTLPPSASTDESLTIAAMKTAIQTFEAAQGALHVEANDYTYLHFLEAVRKLEPDFTRRWFLTENCFKTCCLNGQLNSSILGVFIKSAPVGLQRKVLLNHGGNFIKLRDLPASWSRNANIKEEGEEVGDYYTPFDADM